eukprot:4415317-Amphidinium_carterae.1
MARELAAAQGDARVPRQGRGPGADLQGVTQVISPDGTLHLQVGPEVRERLAEVDLRNLAQYGRRITGDRLRTAKRMFFGRYKRPPDPEERQLF